MQSTEHGRRNYVTFNFDLPRNGGVAIQRLMRARLVVIGGVFKKRFQQVLLTHRDHVVRALSS